MTSHVSFPVFIHEGKTFPVFIHEGILQTDLTVMPEVEGNTGLIPAKHPGPSHFGDLAVINKISLISTYSNRGEFHGWSAYRTLSDKNKKISMK